MSEYPRWGYHAEKPAVIIKSAEHHKKLGEGYYKTPTDLARALVSASQDNELMSEEEFPIPKRKPGRPKKDE